MYTPSHLHQGVHAGVIAPYANQILPLFLLPPPGLSITVLKARGEKSEGVLYPKFYLKTRSPAEKGENAFRTA